MHATDGPVHHRVEITDAPTWFRTTLGFDPTPGITPADWLTTPTQSLAEVTAGAVFHDGLATLTPLRTALAWYPHDIWIRVLASAWHRVADEEAFVGRCGEVGDELGSAVVTASLTRTLMRLCLLMNRRYPPYAKWLGTVFTRTPEGARLTPVLTAALTTAYETLAALHSQLGLTSPLDPTTRPYPA